LRAPEYEVYGLAKCGSGGVENLTKVEEIYYYVHLYTRLYQTLAEQV